MDRFIIFIGFAILLAIIGYEFDLCGWKWLLTGMAIGFALGILYDIVILVIKGGKGGR